MLHIYWNAPVEVYMCGCPAHNVLVDCTCNCDHTNDRLSQYRERSRILEAILIKETVNDHSPWMPGEWETVYENDIHKLLLDYKFDIIKDGNNKIVVKLERNA